MNLIAIMDGKNSYNDAVLVFIAAPTNYKSQMNFYNTTHVEEAIDQELKVNPDATMVIKSSICLI